MTKLLVAVLCIAFATNASVAEPVPPSGLRSPDQKERDKTAAILRQTFKMPDRKPWDTIVAQLTPDMSEAEMRDILRPWLKELHPTMGSMVEEGWNCRFDDVFCVSIQLRRRERTIIRAEIFEHMMSFWSTPPKDYTGVWRSYYCNGVKQGEREIRQGKHHGFSLAYYPDGALQHVMNHADGRLYGSETAYFPSGRLKMRGQYEFGQRVGEWVWYNEDGTIVRSEKVGSP